MKILRTMVLGILFQGIAAQAGQLVRDPSFELGPSNPYWGCSERWQGKFHNGCVGVTQGIITQFHAFPVHTGSWYASLRAAYYPLGGYPPSYAINSTQVWQTVNIPSTVTKATLNFWIHSVNEEAPGLPNPDVVQLDLYDSVSGLRLVTLGRWDTWFSPWTWTKVTIPGLEYWKGSTVRIHFTTIPNTNEDDGHWYIDDVTLDTTP